MNDDQARKLATRIIDTWPTGPRAYIWRTELARLDAEHADATYHQLAANAQRPPTVAQFLACYHNRPTDTPNPRPDLDGMGRNDYLARVAARAEAGSVEAQAELARWERLNRPGLPTGKR